MSVPILYIAEGSKADKYLLTAPINGVLQQMTGDWTCTVRIGDENRVGLGTERVITNTKVLDGVTRFDIVMNDAEAALLVYSENRKGTTTFFWTAKLTSVSNNYANEFPVRLEVRRSVFS